MSLPSPSSLASSWSLDPSVVFLNHGSFGACLSKVLALQSRLRAQLEHQPLRFILRELQPLLDAARVSLASFIGVDPEDLVFVNNPTTGVNTVLHSLRLQAGDQIVLTSQEYNATRNAVFAAAERAGAVVVTAMVPFPLTDPEQIAGSILAAVSERTRLVVMDHVVSQTSCIQPIKKVLDALRAQGIESLIDGAHAPGMLPLDMRTLGATYYAGSCHKWLCAPKGAAFLYVQRAQQPKIRPLVISHGATVELSGRSRFHEEFDWVGTSDYSPYLCVPEALRVLEGLLAGSWSDIYQSNHRLVTEGEALICSALGVAPSMPSQMHGSMATIALPDVFSRYTYKQLHDLLLDSYQLEVQVMPPLNGRIPLLRISAQLYNSREQYAYLADILVKISRLGAT